MMMPTAIGSHALAKAHVAKNARLIDTLVDQGLIIVAKSNLTEFCGLKGVGGWSGVGGMCQSLYIPGGSKPGEKRRGDAGPGGSSTGSAMGVAAGFSPFSLGIETSGSLTLPSSRAALNAFKLTPGSVNMEGGWQVAASFDTVGGMAKSVVDLALLSDVLLHQSKPSICSLVDAIEYIRNGLTVGFVDVDLWRLPPEARGHVSGYNEQSVREYHYMIEFLRRSGASVVHPVFITPPEQWLVEGGTNVGDLMDEILRSQVRAGCKYYLGTLQDSEFKTLQDIIDYNISNPDQNGLLKAQSANMSAQETVKNLEICKKWAATEGVDKVIVEQGVDIIVAPADSFFAGVGVGARYPLASIPFSYMESSGRPYGLHVIAKANEEGKIIKFMGMWEKTIQPRKVPDLSPL